MVTAVSDQTSRAGAVHDATHVDGRDVDVRAILIALEERPI